MRRVLVLLALLTLATRASAQCADGSVGGIACAKAGKKVAPPTPAARARRLMVLPFRNVTRAPADDWLVAGAPLMLSETLGQFTDLAVVPDPTVAAAMRRLSIPAAAPLDETQLRALAEATGGWTSVTGNVIATGNKLRITAQAIDVVTSRIIARGDAEVPAGGDVRQATDRIALSLLKAAGVDAPVIDNIALTTSSVDAYRSYAEGMGLIDQGAYRRAVVALTDAVKRDSTFGRAWAALSLAIVAANGWTELLNPIGTAGQAVEHAVRNSARLPPRTARVIRAFQLTFRADFAAAHRLTDSLVANDPDDVDVLEWVAMVNVFDSRFDPATGLRMGSLTRALEASRLALDHDPGRREIFLIPATIYSFGGGFLGPVVGARRHPVSSLAAEFLTPQDVIFDLDIADTVALVPDSEFVRWPNERRSAARLRAARAGIAWTDRWIVANPNDPEAHLWASRFQEMSHNFAASFDELDRATALGVESNTESLRPRRMSLDELTGRFAAAQALADSLVASGAIRHPPFNPWIDRSRVYVPAVLLRSKQWDKAAAAGAIMRDSVKDQNVCQALVRQMTGLTLVVDSTELRAIRDSLTTHAADVQRSALGSCASALTLPPVSR